MTDKKDPERSLPAKGDSLVASAERRDRRVGLKRRDREVLGPEDFTDADIAALENSRPSSEAAAFDHELKP